jgi:hypothetical protein
METSEMSWRARKWTRERIASIAATGDLEQPGDADGPLIDYHAKGVTADLDGIDTVDGRKAYRLSLPAS